MDDVTTRYTDDVVRKDTDLGGQALLRDLLPQTYAQSYGDLLLARPLFVDHDEITRFGNDLRALFAILTSLPERLFDGDLRRYCAALDMDGRLAELMRMGATGAPPVYARADAYHDGTSFKVLELNVGSELGGIDAAQLNRAYLQIDGFRDFAERYRLGYLDTAAYLAEALRRAGRSVTTDEPVVALIEGSGGLAEHEHVFVAIQEALNRYGIELHLGEIDQLKEHNGKLVLNGVELDVVLRYFSAAQVLADPGGPASLEQVMRAHADGRTALFTPLEGALFASKGSLGILHEPQWRSLFTAGEREVIDRIVPWTRVLGAASGGATDVPVLSGSDRAELVDYCRAHRESLILKPGIGYGAVGVVIGRTVSDGSWDEALASAADQDYVVQRAVVPASEWVLDPDTGAVEDWRANWGIFVTDEGYAGAFVRALKASDGSVISYSNPGTRGTCVFTCPAPDARDRAPTGGESTT
jgi:hypothetical protein